MASVHMCTLPLQMAAAEAQLVNRQHDLANMVNEAEGFLQQERRSRKAARRCVQFSFRLACRGHAGAQRGVCNSNESQYLIATKSRCWMSNRF